ncbi:MAG: putative Ig domain-containing protein, partial [Rhodospirillaceae bacterium]|nr:putative Ig domain-containing protein [Rhodospirillaceae bacterium]
RVRDASGDTDWRYFNIAVEAATGGGQETSHGVGATLPDLPAGSWSPDVTSSGASFSSSGGNTTVQFDDGGYIEEGRFRYTCQSVGGCTLENRSVTSGTVVQTAAGTAPGGGVSGDHGDERATATGVEAGSDTDGVLESGDVDYFRIVVDAPGTLNVYSSGNTDTYGYLEDADGAVLRSNDDGGTGTNFRISEDVSAGTYFVRVRGYSSRTTGEYTLSVRFTESDSQPSFAAGSGPGDQSYTVGTAISALTLPEASGGDGPLTYSLSPEVPGLTFNATTRRLTGMPTAAGTYDMTYRVRDTDGDSDSLTFTIMVESAGGGGQGTTYAVGDTLSDLPTGTWSASIRGGGALLISGDGVTVRLNDEAYFEHGGHRYTCQSTGGCVIENRSVTSGTVVQTASGTAPGDGGTGTDAQPSFATGSNPGDQSYTVGTAIDALTLPEASGGEGPLTYSLSPEVPGLMFDATATVRRLSGTPSVAGTYNMTYRARDVDGDTDSLTFTISVDDVADNGPAGSFDLHEDNWSAKGITYAKGRFHVVDSRGDKVYAYTEEGTRDATADIELHEDNSDPWGIAYANGRFYVVDWRDNKVYAYTETGGRDASAEFNLHEDNSNARGITHANGRFYVVDWSDEKVYAYAQTGTRDVTVEFDLHDDNWTAGGIAHANDRFYVVNLNDDKVYAYAETGGHDVSAEFGLRDENSTPHGIAHANGRFYIVDWTDRELYVYSVSDQRALVEFNLYDDNSDPYGIAHSNGRFYVLDRFDDKVYAYTEAGARDAAADFDLHGDNSYPEKIAYANGRFYVLDGIDDKVYAYTETGTRVASADFDLHDDNSDPHGIAYANGRFYVVDRSGDKVYAYSETGGRDTSADLHLDDGNSYPKGIAYANDRFYVLDRYKVYAYWRYSGQRGMSADFLLHDDHHVPEGIAYDNGRFYIVDYVNDRVYSYPETVDPDGPDLMAAPTSVSASELSAGASYTLSAIVRNRGNQPSAAATLRYYRSADPIISASDTEIGTNTVAGLSAGAISTESINLTAPIGNDCYYCGACVEAADGESITSNNCSNSVLIAVGEQADIAVSRTVVNAPSSGTVGVSRISMTVDVTNRGQVASPPSKLIFSGGRSISVDIPVLAPGETMTLSRDVGTVQIGTSTYRACIDFPCDPASQNNCRSRSVTYL